jgi:hypothetical protein
MLKIEDVSSIIKKPSTHSKVMSAQVPPALFNALLRFASREGGDRLAIIARIVNSLHGSGERRQMTRDERRLILDALAWLLQSTMAMQDSLDDLHFPDDNQDDDAALIARLRALGL